MNTKDQGCFLRKFVLYVSIILLFFTTASSHMMHVEASEKKKVKVGYYLTAAYQEIDEDGYYNGYGYEYYKQIAQYANWDIEFVVGSFSECLQMLKDGEIDVMNGLAYDETRLSYLSYADESNSYSTYEMYISKSEQDIYYEDYERFDGMKVAVLKGNLQVAALEEYEKEHAFHLEKVEYGSQLDMENALQSGEVDAVYASNISNLQDNKIVAKFKPIELFFVVNNHRPDILEELNTAFIQLKDNNPSFEIYLQNKYQQQNQSYSCVFTKKEMEFLEADPVIYVYTVENWKPFMYYDSGTNTYQGIIVDFLSRIQEVSGLTFTYLNENEMNAMLADNPDAMNNMIAILSNDFNWADNKQMELSTAFLDAPVVMVERNGQPLKEIGDRKVALAENFCTSWLLERRGLPGHITYYKDNQACLNAVSDGEADCAYVNTYVANYYLSQYAYDNLYTVNLANFSESLTIGIAKYADPSLLSVINKALVCVSGDEIQTMILKNMKYNQELTLKEIMEINPQYVAGGILILVFLLFMIAFYIFMEQTKKRELLTSLAMEEKANEAKSTFLATMSHEIRTPLNAVIGYISMAQEHEENPFRVKEYHTKAQAAARHLLSVINDVLDISAISNGKLTISREAFDMKDLINGLNAMFYQQAREKGIQFRVDVSELSYEYVVGDKLRINQVLLNLLSNSVKFTGTDGRISLIIDQKKISEEMLEVTFIVQDTGIGMTQEYLDKIFTPFEQQDATITRKYGGSGLGLSITRRLVEMMDGSIQVESKENEGSKFTLKIPMGIAAGNRNRELNESITKIRVLIVDDAEANCDYAKAMLKRLGMKSDVVHDGASALRQIMKRKGTNYEYGICLIDWQMDGMDGVETTRMIRQQGDSDIQIIILTAYDLSMVTKEAKAAGADAVITKPLFQSVLLDLLVNKYGNLAKEEIVTRDFSGLKVLLVEDNEMNMEISEDILKKAKLQVVKAVNGKEAVDYYLQSAVGQIQAILMDIQMPVMDGYEATKLIRTADREDAQTIPIIALTANAFAEDVQKALDAGMNGHIAKPISKKALFELLDKVLG